MNGRILMTLRLVLAITLTFSLVSLVKGAWISLAVAAAFSALIAREIGGKQWKQFDEVAEIGKQILGLGGIFIDHSAESTPACLRSLNKLILRPASQIVHLDLAGAPVSDDDLLFLTQLRKLRSMDLSQTAVSDALFHDVPPMQHLQILRLSGTRLTDEGCEWIARCKQLRQIDLGGTSVTDRGIQLLESLPLLQNMELQDTLVSASLVQRYTQLKHELGEQQLETLQTSHAS